MNSRENILRNIVANKPSFTEAPDIDSNNVIEYDDLVFQFQNIVKSIGVETKIVSEEEIKKIIAHSLINDTFSINSIESFGEVNQKLKHLSSFDLANVDKAFIEGTVAVAENGAVWVPETKMINRLLPFICECLFLVIKEDDIVATMHQAYKAISIGDEGFAVFIAGPSKTADIEQNLVIGAHGPKKLTVLIY